MFWNSNFQENSCSVKSFMSKLIWDKKLGEILLKNNNCNLYQMDIRSRRGREPGDCAHVNLSSDFSEILIKKCSKLCATYKKGY